MRHVLILCFVLSPLLAQEHTLREQLREALYTEEVTRDPAAAATQYEKLLADFREQRALAATALFRLAEVRRKQDRKDEAIALYQRLLQEFPDFATEAKLARENLAALGAKPAEPMSWAADEESLELRRLQSLAETAPDILRDPRTLESAIGKEWPRVAAFLLEGGADANGEGLLSDAAFRGRLDLCKLLMEHARPTPKEGLKALDDACRKGRLNVLSHLLENGVNPNPAKGAKEGSPLHRAIRDRQLEAAKLLIKHGADVNFVSHWRLCPIGNEFFGTPLHQAVHGKNLEAVRLLLAEGADPNVPTPVFGITPLHVAAVDRTNGGSALLGVLLENGANPNLATTLQPDDKLANDSLTAHYILSTPLQLAVMRQNAASVQSLLARGADANTMGRDGSPMLEVAMGMGGMEIIKLLLDAGADPDVREPRGYPLLFQAASTEVRKLLLDAGADPNVLDQVGRSLLGISDLPTATLLLEAGADPNLPSGELQLDLGEGCDDPFAETPGQVLVTTRSPLWEASRDEKRLPVFKALLNAGATPGPALGFILQRVAPWDLDGSLTRKLLEFRPDRFNPDEIPEIGSWPVAARNVFVESCLVPECAEESRITFVAPDTGYVATLEERTESSPPPSLSLLLLDHREVILRPGARNGSPSTSVHYQPVWHTFTVMRCDADGTWLPRPVDLTGDAPFPDLQWGDVLIAGQWLAESGHPGFTDHDDIVTLFDWNIRRRITFPITVEIDGHARNLTVNGALFAYDPTKDEVPWLDAARLAGTLVPALGTIAEASVKRPGWDDIRVLGDGAIPSTCPLQEGDRLVITTRKSAFSRSAKVMLTVPGFPVMRYFGANSNNPRTNTPPLSTCPTLVQAIVDTYAPPWRRDWFSRRYGDQDIKPWMVAAYLDGVSDALPTLPGHPDFSRIRIRRLAEDGDPFSEAEDESILDVDLSAAIARCTDETPNAVAQSVDIPLRPGDIVELPLHEDRFGQQWTGFSPEETRFFRKALGGWVQFFQLGTEPQRLELAWEPPEWKAGPHGLLPIPPETGFATMRAELVLSTQEDLAIERNGEQFPKCRSGDLFLRDRDQIHSSKMPAPRSRRIPQPQRR